MPPGDWVAVYHEPTKDGRPPAKAKPALEAPLTAWALMSYEDNSGTEMVGLDDEGNPCSETSNFMHYKHTGKDGVRVL